MADKKIEKALYGPSLMEVFFGAVLGLLVGVAAGAVYLVFKPVQMVKELPKEPLRSVVYYIPGSEGGAKSKGWQAKLKLYTTGKTVQVVEEELNAWSGTLSATAGPPAPAAPAAKPPAKAPAPAAKPAPAPAAAKPADAKPATEGIFTPGKPNFRIVGGKLQIGLTCTLNWYGMTQDVTMKVTGGFRKDGDHVEFVTETLYLGSCPLHLLPAAAQPLANHLLAKEKIPDDIHAAWAKLSDATIEGATLTLAVR